MKNVEFRRFSHFADQTSVMNPAHLGSSSDSET